jgi:hypothetical protein
MKASGISSGVQTEHCRRIALALIFSRQIAGISIDRLDPALPASPDGRRPDTPCSPSGGTFQPPARSRSGSPIRICRDLACYGDLSGGSISEDETDRALTAGLPAMPHVHGTILDRLGHTLRMRDDDIAQQPLPHRWVDLIHHLDEQERGLATNKAAREKGPKTHAPVDSVNARSK